jgi:hypothetical protein
MRFLWDFSKSGVETLKKGDFNSTFSGDYPHLIKGQQSSAPCGKKGVLNNLHKPQRGGRALCNHILPIAEVLAELEQSLREFVSPLTKLLPD